MEQMGLLHLYYGDGKGKTTAAMGLALRALGSGKKVVIVQFLKGGKSGEIPLLEQLPIGCRLGPRCPYAQRECIETPRLTGVRNHLYACHFPLNMEKE